MTYSLYLLKSVMFVQSSILFSRRSEELPMSFDEVAWKFEVFLVTLK